MTNSKYATTALHHEITNLSNGKRKLHVYAYGHDLTKDQRTLTDKSPEIIKEDAEFFSLLNEKVNGAVNKDSHWLIDELPDWRSWANSFVNEFYDKQSKEMAIEIRKAQAKALGEEYHEEA